MEKPEKIVYDNQEEVHDKIVSFAQSQLGLGVNEAYLVGSATTKKFGKYTEKFRGHDGSDIDVVAFVDEIPKNWKNLNMEKTWWRGYRGGKLEVNEILHKVEVMVVKHGMEEFAHKRMRELGWKPERLK